MLRSVLSLLISFFTIGVFAQPAAKDVLVHDPVLIKQGSRYYLFSTGNGIKVQSSSDLKDWKVEKPVFAAPPAWATQLIEGFKGHIWAPDISYHNNLYYLYYSISTFGKNTSAIGVATNETLNPLDSNFKWVDHGKVIESVAGKNHWNAIDPNLISDELGNNWLVFGSFWDGIKMVALEKDLLRVKDQRTLIETIASRKQPGEQGNNPIEAPFIFRKDGYYYLFASIDYCCKGAESTYKMVVGRSKKVTGPYVDQKGIDLKNGGGTLLLSGDQNWHGVGHNAVYHTDGKDLLIFHGYDAQDNGKAKLRISTLTWANAWPRLKK